MIDLALSVLAFVAGGLALKLYADRPDSSSYEDKKGLFQDAEKLPLVEDCPNRNLS